MTPGKEQLADGLTFQHPAHVLDVCAPSALQYSDMDKSLSFSFEGTDDDPEEEQASDATLPFLRL